MTIDTHSGLISWMPLNDDVGSYEVLVRVTDLAGASDTQQFTLEVSPATTIIDVHVGDLDATSLKRGRTWTAAVTITVLDNAGGPVSGATVTGDWGGGVSGSDEGVTGSDGQVTVQLSGISRAVGVVTFTVSSVTGTNLNYVAASNVDPDGDSNGTTIL